MPPKRKQQKSGKAKQQPQITTHVLPLLKKPMETIGKQVNVRGDYYEGKMTAAEKETLYKHTVRDFTNSHKFPNSLVPEAAVQLQEMGVTGTGSTEHGDASGAIFWMRYQPDFLKCYYETYPDEMPSPQKAPTIELEPVAVDDGPDKPDVHPDYPHVRLGRAPVMGFFSITADTLVEMGPKSGSYKAAFECIIEAEDGRTCGVRREIYHKRDRAVSTSNLIAHLRTCAPNCPAHKAALMKIEASSKNCIECDGETVMWCTTSPRPSRAPRPSPTYGLSSACHPVHPVHPFSPVTPSGQASRGLRVHVCAHGIVSQNIITKPEFQAYVRGYEPRAAFPHKATIRQLVEVVCDLQNAERMERFEKLKVQYQGKPCVGIQLDCWSDTDTHTSFACLSATEVKP